MFARFDSHRCVYKSLGQKDMRIKTNRAAWTIGGRGALPVSGQPSGSRGSLRLPLRLAPGGLPTMNSNDNDDGYVNHLDGPVEVRGRSVDVVPWRLANLWIFVTALC